MLYFHLTPDPHMRPDPAFQPADGWSGGTFAPRLFVSQHPRFWLPWFGLDDVDDLSALHAAVFDLSALQQGRRRFKDGRWQGDPKDFLRGPLEGPPEAWVFPHAYPRLAHVETLPYPQAKAKYRHLHPF